MLWPCPTGGLSEKKATVLYFLVMLCILLSGNCSVFKGVDEFPKCGSLNESCLGNWS